MTENKLQFKEIIPRKTIIRCETEEEAKQLWEHFYKLGYVDLSDKSDGLLSFLNYFQRRRAFLLDDEWCHKTWKVTDFNNATCTFKDLIIQPKKESSVEKETICDPWKLAKAIQYGYTDSEMEAIFGTTNRAGLMETYTPDELYQQILAYLSDLEKKQIHVNDIVWIPSMRLSGVVLRQNPQNKMWSIMTKNLKYAQKKSEDLVRTGEQIDMDAIIHKLAEAESQYITEELIEAQDDYENDYDRD